MKICVGIRAEVWDQVAWSYDAVELKGKLRGAINKWNDKQQTLWVSLRKATQSCSNVNLN